MTVSFDLDDTLICTREPVEPLGWLARMRASERLRLGTRELFIRLGEAGVVPSIYTTSLRPHRAIRRLFLLHGLRLDRIVTAADHAGVLARRGGNYAKVPDELGFDVHVDDAPVCPPGFRMNAVILLVEAGPLWADNLWHAIRRQAALPVKPADR